MLRMGKNRPEQPSADETADYSTPVNQNAANTNAAPAYNANPYGTSAPASGTNPSPPTSSTPTYPSSSGYQGGAMAQDPNISRPVTESESLAREIKEGNLSGFVGMGTSLTGEANFKAMLRVDGHLSGRVSSSDGTLIVSAGGQVDADVQVSIALINGTVNGDVTATKRIEMGRVAKVNGNIQTPALVVEQGAIFEGSCRMTQAQTAPNASTSSATTASGASPTSSSANTDTKNSSSKPYGKTDSATTATATTDSSSDAAKSDSAASVAG